ncbi:hypothetical protein BH23GEM10_BH23GEM10_04290 [soil metagenome]
MSNIGASHGPDAEPLLEQTGFRLSWGAIIAGMLVATALHIVFALVGLAIGMDTWQPGDRLDTLGGRLGVWIIVSGIIALFVGGMVTGRLAGVLTRGDGALHGVVLWSVSTLLAAYLVASGVGTIVGGAFGVMSRTTAAAAGGLSGAVGELGRTAVQQVTSADLDEIRIEVERTLEQTGAPALRPDTLAADAERVGVQTTGGASNQAVASEIMSMISQRSGQIDRQALINVITARTDLNQQEAERLATRLETLSTNAYAQVESAVGDVGERVEGVAGDASDLMASASWWSLLALGLSLVGAVGGTSLKARD